MAVALATTTDLEARWRPLSTAEEATAATLLNDASAILRSRIPTIDDQVGAGTVDPDIVTHVVARMVRRAMENTPGVRSRTQTIGPYSDGITLSGDAPTELVLTDADLALLLPPTATSKRVGTITVGSPFLRRETVTLPDGTTEQAYDAYYGYPRGPLPTV